MTLKSTTRIFHLRFVQGGFPSDDGQYGAKTYADDTYGQREGETALPGISYVIQPVPASRPETALWYFRVGDTAKEFRARVVPSDDPQNPMDLTPVVAATLLLTETGVFVDNPLRLSFDLTVDGNDLVRNWEDDDLTKQGRYIVNIRILFASGRYMTIEPDDDDQLEIQDRTISLSP